MALSNFLTAAPASMSQVARLNPQSAIGVPTVSRVGQAAAQSQGTNYAEAVTGVVEVRTQPLWHHVAVPAALTMMSQFFNVAMGANRYTTNLRQAAQLPGGVAFRIRRIAVSVCQACTNADVILINDNGCLVLQVQGKEVFEAPVRTLGGVGNAIANQLAVAADSVTHGLPSQEAQFRLAEPIVIKGGVNFGVTIFWGAAGITLGAATDVGVFLYGEMLIPIT